MLMHVRPDARVYVSTSPSSGTVHTVRLTNRAIRLKNEGLVTGTQTPLTALACSNLHN